jgi:hypothetical protein
MEELPGIILVTARGAAKAIGAARTAQRRVQHGVLSAQAQRGMRGLGECTWGAGGLCTDFSVRFLRFAGSFGNPLTCRQ